jgi:hypothetical protein
MSTAFNYVLYQVGWFSCVMGAAWSHPWVGTAMGSITLAAHLTLAERRWEELRLACLIGAVGACVDGLQLAAGTLSFVSGGSLVHWLPPGWLLLLWMQFAGTLRFSLRWLTFQPRLAILFGATGGPLVYVAVSRLGVVRIQSPQWQSLLVLSALWAVAMWVATWLARDPGSVNPGRYRI